MGLQVSHARLFVEPVLWDSKSLKRGFKEPILMGLLISHARLYIEHAWWVLSPSGEALSLSGKTSVGPSGKTFELSLSGHTLLESLEAIL